MTQGDGEGVTFGDSMADLPGTVQGALQGLAVLFRLKALRKVHEWGTRLGERLKVPLDARIVYPAKGWAARRETGHEGEVYWSLFLDEPEVDRYLLSTLQRWGDVVVAVEWDHSGRPRCWVLETELEQPLEPLEAHHAEETRQRRAQWGASAYVSSHQGAPPLVLSVQSRTLRVLPPAEGTRPTPVVQWTTREGVDVEMPLETLRELAGLEELEALDGR